MVSRSSRKEFRTSVILTEAQFMRVREIAQANDASIAWVFAKPSTATWMAQGATLADRPGKPPGTTQERLMQGGWIVGRGEEKGDGAPHARLVRQAAREPTPFFGTS